MKKIILILPLFILFSYLLEEKELENTDSHNIKKISRKISSTERQSIAKVLNSSGLVFKKTPTDKVLLNKNSPLFEGDIIQTKSKSFVKIVMDDKTTLNLGPNSEMILSEFKMKDIKKRKNVIHLMYGVLKSHFHIKNKIDGLYVKTPTSSMGVRGTEFITKYVAGYTEMYLLSGKVEVKDKKKTLLVNPQEYYNEKETQVISVSKELHEEFGQYLEQTPKEEIILEPRLIIPRKEKKKNMNPVKSSEIQNKRKNKFSRLSDKQTKTSNNKSKSTGPEVIVPKEKKYSYSDRKEKRTKSTLDIPNKNQKLETTKKTTRNSRRIINSFNNLDLKREKTFQDEKEDRLSDSEEYISDQINESLTDPELNDLRITERTPSSEENIDMNQSLTNTAGSNIIQDRIDQSDPTIGTVLETDEGLIQDLGFTPRTELCLIDSFVYYGFEEDFIQVSQYLENATCRLKLKGENPYDYTILTEGEIKSSTTDTLHYILKVEKKDGSFNQIYSKKTMPELFKIEPSSSSEYLPSMFYIEEHCPCQ